MLVRDFEQDRKICDAATKGPLKAGRSDAVSYAYGQDQAFKMVYCEETRSVENAGDIPVVFATAYETEGVDCRANAAFIAAAREGWPAALDEVKRLSENINAYAFESGRVSLKCQDQSKEIEILKRQLQVAANMEACEGRCPETKECPTDRDCVECWLEHWRQKAGEGAK